MIEIVESRGLQQFLGMSVEPVAIKPFKLGGGQVEITPYYRPRDISIERVDENIITITVDALERAIVTVRGEKIGVVSKEIKKIAAYTAIIVLSEDI